MTDTIDTETDAGPIGSDRLDDINDQLVAIFEKRDASDPGSAPADVTTDDAPDTTDTAAETTDPAGDPAGTDPAGGVAGGGDVQPPAGADDGGADDAGGDDPVGAVPGALTLTLEDGSTFEVTEAVARQWGALAAWAQRLPAEVTEQFGAIEQGQAVAVPRSDYEQFEAWRRNQSRNEDRWADLDDADRAYIAQLEQQNAQLAQSRATAPAVADNMRRADIAADAFSSTLNSYAAERRLTADEASWVYETAIRSGVIGSLADQGRIYSPTGQLIADCDYADVARKAFDFALVQNPELHARTVSAPGAPTVGGDPIPGLPPTEAPDPTVAKKAAAGSLAAAPSAAPNNPPFNPALASPQDVAAAMAEEIRQAMNGQ